VTDSAALVKPSKRRLFGFIAGFVSTLTFHQLTLAAVWKLGLAPFAPFSLAATAPFGVPAVISLAFWGGLWGVLLAWVEHRFPPPPHYWTVAFLFGAILPPLVAVLVVFPLKGQTVTGNGWSLLLTAILINGAWGLGAGWVLRMLSAR
jgi:hypothetical protein